MKLWKKKKFNWNSLKKIFIYEIKRLQWFLLKEIWIIKFLIVHFIGLIQEFSNFLERFLNLMNLY